MERRLVLLVELRHQAGFPDEILLHRFAVAEYVVLPPRAAPSTIQVFSQTDDAHVTVLAERKQRLVSRDDRVCTTGYGALEDTVVWIVLYRAKSSPRLYEEAEVRQEYGGVRQFLCIAREFAPQDTKQLVENRLGKDKLVFLCNDAPQGRFAPAAGEYQGRHQDVCVEDDLHPRR